FQKRAERLRASLLLDTQADIDLVFGFWKEPEIASRRLFRVEVNVAVERLHFNAVPEFRVQTRGWLNIVLVDLFLNMTGNRKIPTKLSGHSRSIYDKFGANLERLIDAGTNCLAMQPDNCSVVLD